MDRPGGIAVTDYGLMIDRASRPELLQIVILASAKLATPTRASDEVPAPTNGTRPRDALITAKEAADLAQVTIGQIYTWSWNHEMGCSMDWALRTKAKRLHRIKREAFLAWFEARGR